MPRIQRTIPGTSYSNPAIDEKGQDKGYDPRDEDAGFFETADRAREVNLRGPMHDTSDSMTDARNTDRGAVSPMTYRPPTNLDAPKPRPGMVQRWVRASFRTDGDNLNWQTKSREGWKPRDPATVPQYEAFYGKQTHNGQAVISVGGLILVEIPEHMLAAKRKYIREQSRKQELSVIQETEQMSRTMVNQGHSPIIREETDEVRTGRRPATMAN